MSVAFEPVTRQTVAETIRARLAAVIASGELPPGAPVPAERALSEQFGVARTSVREAVQGLVSLGVVERRGNRTYVAELLPGVAFASPEESAADSRKLFVAQLFETRRMLEPAIFELAARRATPAEREEIWHVVDAVPATVDLAEFQRHDRVFHTLLASACGNPLLVELYGKVIDALFRSEEFDSLLYAEANRSQVDALIARSLADHRRIAAALRDGSPDDVRAACQLHLDNVEHRIVDELI